MVYVEKFTEHEMKRVKGGWLFVSDQNPDYFDYA